MDLRTVTIIIIGTYNVVGACPPKSTWSIAAQLCKRILFPLPIRGWVGLHVYTLTIDVCMHTSQQSCMGNNKEM